MTTTHPSGFAPAASPLAPTMIHTPDGAISAGITSIPSQGDDMPAYYARPKASDGALSPGITRLSTDELSVLIRSTSGIN